MSESEFPQLPAHLSEYHRDTLLIQPEVCLQQLLNSSLLWKKANFNKFK